MCFPYRMLFVASAALASVFMESCTLPPFVGGIRMVAYEALLEAPGSTRLPVARVNDTGSVLQVFGGGTGSDENFIGLTGPDGRDDHPNALTNANWGVTFNYNFSASPSCGTGSLSGFVPVAGAEFDETCLL